MTPKSFHRELAAKIFDAPDADLLLIDNFFSKQNPIITIIFYIIIPTGGNTKCRCTTRWSQPPE